MADLSVPKVDWFDFKRFLASAAFFVLLALVLQNVIDRAWPASYWLRVDTIKIADARQGEIPAMTVKRKINRSFTGFFNVELEIKAQRQDGYVIFCRAVGDSTRYRTSNVLPDDLDLDWWVDSACMKTNKTRINVANLPVGTYVVETCWTIQPDVFFSERRTCAESNAFQVHAL